MRLRRILVPGLVALSAAIGCDGMLGHDAADTGKSAAAINQGITDSTNRFPAVGRVNMDGGCTGVLVAPQWVATARHCTNNLGDANQIALSVTEPAPANRVFAHTLILSGPVKVPAFWNGPSNTLITFTLDQPLHYANDVALIKLDKPVPPEVALPHRPASVAGNAPCSQPKTSVGYGPQQFDAGITSAPRNYFEASNWSANPIIDPITSEHRASQWYRPPTYAGTVIPNDSGGPLFEGLFASTTEPQYLCGIASAGNTTNGNVFANIEGPSVYEFFEATLTDFNNGGRVRGDCYVTPGTPGIDDDGDGVKDFGNCDKCVGIHDPAQLDSDGDGVGDACDNCRFVKNSTQQNSGVFGQNDSLNIASTDRTPPHRPTHPDEVDAWLANYPGDACNPYPLSAIRSATGRRGSDDNPRTGPRPVNYVCFPGSTSSTETAPLSANNVITLESFSAGSSATLLANTRLRVCQCGAQDNDNDLCLSQCPRTNIESPDDLLWTAPTMKDGDTVASVPSGSGFIPTKHPALPPSGQVGPTPATRDLRWTYWADLTLTAPTAPYDTVLRKPLVWSWVKNYDVARPDPIHDATTDSSHRKRRGDIFRLFLRERPEPRFEFCPSALAGALPRRSERIPMLEGCIRCGRAATFRLPHIDVPMAAQYIAPHFGSRPFADFSTTGLSSLFADDDLAFVVATDGASGVEVGTDRGAVYKKATHELVGTIFKNNLGQLAFRELSVTESLLAPSFGAGVAMSATRNEVAFFDAFSFFNFDRPAVRFVNLTEGYTSRLSLVIVDSPFAGPVVAAAYRESDNSYFTLSRGAGKIRLHRVGPNLAVQMVAEWADAETATYADLTSSEEGVLAITSRSPSGFSVVAITVSESLSVTVLSHISSSMPLSIGAMATPEGLALELPGPTSDTIYPFIQQGEPPITYHSLVGSGWQEIFE